MPWRCEVYFDEAQALEAAGLREYAVAVTQSHVSVARAIGQPGGVCVPPHRLRSVPRTSSNESIEVWPTLSSGSRAVQGTDGAASPALSGTPDGHERLPLLNPTRARFGGLLSFAVLLSSASPLK
jgi:hypothetical protein